ncbi:hypothetical protein CDD81_6264 [Ophiocordyceps australis]|uniref:C2H2-type domain-containing protein n=1 Tax=Ophiocordyceps australis TaxID=1399860 RepID=A0A2C5Y662_9HYPO|nr:hypothetical protein CDD81_6264 [Ophiocordyceps australis]
MARPSITAYRDIREFMTVQRTLFATKRRAGSRASRSDSADDQDPLSADAPLRESELHSIARDDVTTSVGRSAGRGVSRAIDRAIDRGESRGAMAKLESGRSRIAVVLSTSPHKRPFSKAQGRKMPRERAIRSDGASLPIKTSAVATSSGQAVKKRGRPLGWKRGESYAEALADGSIPPVARGPRARAQAAGIMKRRGRPPKAPSPPPCDIYQQLRPQFVDYICEWAGCKAELHNLETLQRHIYAIHGQAGRGEGLVCRWGRCGRGERAKRFGSEGDFCRHVDQRHLASMAWQVGDGPQNSSCGFTRGEAETDRLPAYLMDASGKQVTPSVRGQEIEDAATWRMNRRRLKDLLILRDALLPDDDESETGSEHA